MGKKERERELLLCYALKRNRTEESTHQTKKRIGVLAVLNIRKYRYETMKCFNLLLYN
jgi:hypothetical protein